MRDFKNYYHRFNDWKIAALVFLVVTLIFGSSLFSVFGKLGFHDWDQHLFYEGAARETFLRYGQFPLWSPWQCGGTVLLANPQSSFLSVHFPLTLLFGPPLAMQFAILLYLFIGLLGMWFLCRELKFSTLACYISSVLVMFSGQYAVRMAVGHTNWYHVAWIPWVVFFFLKAKVQLRYLLASSFVLALAFLGGGIYPFVFSFLILFLFAIFDVLEEHSLRSILYFLGILVLFALFSAVKLVPMLAVASEMLPVHTPVAEPYTFSHFILSLFGRNTDLKQVWYSTDLDGTSVSWNLHEYFSYVGVVPLILFLLSFVFLLKGKERMFPLSALLVSLVLLFVGFFPRVWFFLLSIPGASFLYAPSRFIFVVVFFLALSVGALLTLFEQRWKPQSFLLPSVPALFLFLFLVVDLTLVNGTVIGKSFAADLPRDLQSTDFFSVAAEGDASFGIQYLLLLRNKGIVNCYERFHLPSAALARQSTSGGLQEGYIGEAYLLETRTPLPITFTPNKFTVSLASLPSLEKEVIVVLNQNFVSGWKVSVDGVNWDVLSSGGLVSAKVPLTASEVVFVYFPKSFVVGAVVSVLMVVFFVVLLYFFWDTKFI